MSRSPSGIATAAPPAGPPKLGGRAKLRVWLIGLPDHRIIGGGISLLAWLWPFLKWFWTIPLAVTTGVAVVFLATPQSSKTGPQTSIGVGLIVSYGGWLLGGCGFLILLSIGSAVSVALKIAAIQEAKRHKEEAEEQARLAREEVDRQAQRQHEEAERERRARPFVLKPVEQLDPHREPYIHQYVKDAYLPREADEQARAALRAAMSRTGGAPLGICIVGQPALGKTRLAFEALRAALADWTLVKWPHNTRPEDFDFAAQTGKKLVLWLDDLHEYAGQTEAPTLLDLPGHFEDVAERLVVVATCRDGEEQKRAEATLSGLLERLIPVQPTEITDQQADVLTDELERVGQETQREEFDGTPGSVVLGVRRMAERYKKLEKDAQRLLLAMKLLLSVQIYDYPVPRVRAVAVEVLHLTAPHWHDALEQAVEQGFLHHEALAADEEGELAPRVDVYLDRAVPTPTSDMTSFWPALEQSLTRRHDADALFSLGIAFGECPRGNRRANRQHAAACCRAALEVYTRQEMPVLRARMQNYLGIMLHDQAELAEGAERARLLEQAAAAYRAALEVRTRQASPDDWAATQYKLALVHLDRAAALEEEDKDAAKQALIAAWTCVISSLEVYTQKDMPANYRDANKLRDVVEEVIRSLDGQPGK